MEIAAALESRSLLPAGAWRVDGSSSRIGFSVRKLGLGTVRGHFADAGGGGRRRGLEHREAGLRARAYTRLVAVVTRG